MIRAAVPALAEVYGEKTGAREQKKAKRGTKGRRAGMGVKSTSRTKPKGDADYDGGESVPKTAAGSKAAETRSELLCYYYTNSFA